jgi:hypothetical protein
MIYKIICKNCSNEFSVKKHSLYLKRKYCSSKCSQLASRGVHKIFTEEHKKNIGLAGIGRTSHIKNMTLEQRYGLKKAMQIIKNISIGKTGKKLSEEHKKNVGLSLKGHITLEETKKKISIANSGENNGMYGKFQSKEVLEKIRQTRKKTENELGYYHSTETKKKIGKTTKELWKDDNYKKSHREKFKDPEFHKEWLKKVYEGLRKRPTSYEQKISNLCFKYNLPFVYTGDGSFIINFKNPDFTNHKDKIVIEVFYSWFKIRDYGSIENYKEFCRNKYNPQGWRVIFIDETEIDIDNWENACLNKIKEVNYGS